MAMATATATAAATAAARHIHHIQMSRLGQVYEVSF